MKPKQWKPGDRCAVYRAGFKKPIIGTVTQFNEEFSSVGFTEDGFYSAHNDSPFHSRQCVRLVKKKRERVFVIQDLLGDSLGLFSSLTEARESGIMEPAYEILEFVVVKRHRI